MRIIISLISFLIVATSQIYSQNDGEAQAIGSRMLPLSSENIFKTDGYYNWCSSILKDEDGLYHLFYSRWPKQYQFTAWLTHSEIAHATSNSPSGPWKYKETVLKGSGTGSWDDITAHNPKIKYFNGTFYIYYVATNLGEKAYTEEELIETARVGYSHPNWKVLRPNQRSGVVVSKSINGPWIRGKQALIEPSGPITTLTVNPAITDGSDGKFYLIVKGDKPNEKRFIRNQAVAISDSPTGPFTMQTKPVIDYIDTEDMSIWFDDKSKLFYGVFHAHNFIGLIKSNDGVNWEKAEEYQLMKKELLLENGDKIFPDRLERPFVFIEDGIPTVLSLAVKKENDSYIVFIPIKKEE